MFKHNLLCLLSSFLSLLPHTLFATPIDIQSDKAYFEEKTGNAIHEGHVHATQGERQLWSDSLTIHRSKSGKIDHIPNSTSQVQSGKRVGSPFMTWRKGKRNVVGVKGAKLALRIV